LSTHLGKLGSHLECVVDVELEMFGHLVVLVWRPLIIGAIVAPVVEDIGPPDTADAPVGIDTHVVDAELGTTAPGDSHSSDPRRTLLILQHQHPRHSKRRGSDLDDGEAPTDQRRVTVAADADPDVTLADQGGADGQADTPP